MSKLWTVIGALTAFLAVALGAFGAHGLEKTLSPHLLDVYKTGAYYQLIHSIGLLLIGVRSETRPGCRLLFWCGALFTAGILLFSGSLYILALTGVLAWGAVTPLGGLCFMAGWLVLAAAALTDSRSKKNE